MLDVAELLRSSRASLGADVAGGWEFRLVTDRPQASRLQACGLFN
jgi:hypothetical protein